jgi:hypothetical protein
VQPERRVRNPHHSESSSRRRHGRDPKGLGAKAPRSGARNMPLILCFHALTDTVRDTTEELRNVAAKYPTSIEATQVHLAPSNSREVSSDVAF